MVEYFYHKLSHNGRVKCLRRIFMKKYLTIGEVSRIMGVGIKSLRYYDRLNILKPAYVDPENGYRYYTREQLPTVDLIILFIDLGIPLREFDRYTDGRGRVDLKALLKTGEASARRHIAALKGKLIKMERISRALENGELHRSEEHPYTRRIEARHALVAPWPAGKESAEAVAHIMTDLYFRSCEAGLTALYQSGVVYDYSGGKPERWLYLETLEKAVRPDFRLFPGQEYLCAMATAGDEPLAALKLDRAFTGTVIAEDQPLQGTDTAGCIEFQTCYEQSGGWYEKILEQRR